jgi:hypothetical protein
MKKYYKFFFSAKSYVKKHLTKNYYKDYHKIIWKFNTSLHKSLNYHKNYHKIIHLHEWTINRRKFNKLIHTSSNVEFCALKTWRQNVKDFV